MVFSSIPLYHLDPPNWSQQPNQHPGGNSENNGLPPPPPPPLQVGGGGGAGSIRPGSMADRARLAKIAQPEAALKCPRCDSPNTKFCYFNNYSLSQPRYFCKTCRRYWTRGGALRNVPVGGGCRRNKRSKGSRSKSPATAETSQGGSSSTSSIPSNMQPPPQLHLPFLPSLHHMNDYGGASNIGLNFGGVQQPSVVAAAAGVIGGGSILSAGLGEQWRLQQLQEFPFLAGLEPPASSGLYSYGHSSDAVETHGFFGAGSPARSKSMDTVKMEENQGLNLSRNFLGVQGNDQYWGVANAWTDLSGFNSSSTSHLL